MFKQPEPMRNLLEMKSAVELQISRQLEACLALEGIETPDLEEIVGHVVSNNVTWDEIDVQASDGQLDAVTLDADDPRHATSIKISNARVNLADVLETTAGTLINIAGALMFPILAVLAALVAVRAFKKALTVELSSDQALIVFAMWRCGCDEPMSMHSIDSAVSSVLEEFGRSPLHQSRLESMVRALVDLGCLAHDSERGTYRIVEKVVIR